MLAYYSNNGYTIDVSPDVKNEMNRLGTEAYLNLCVSPM